MLCENCKDNVSKNSQHLPICVKILFPNCKKNPTSSGCKTFFCIFCVLNARKSREMETRHMWNSCDGVCGAVRGAEKAACHFSLHSSPHSVTIWGKDSNQPAWNCLWVIRASQLSIFLTYFPLSLPAICSPLTPPPLPHILIYISPPSRTFTTVSLFCTFPFYSFPIGVD